MTARNQFIKSLRSLTGSQRLRLVFAFAIMLFALLVVLDNRITGSDDTVFIEQTASYHSVIDWVSARYQNWSGRAASEGVIYVFSNLPIAFWQIVTIGMYAFLSALLFCYYRLIVSQKKHAKTDVFALTAALILPYLLDKSVFAEGILWMTGGTVYLWTFTIMLLALYTPVKHVLTNKLPAWWFIATSYLSTIIVTFSQEQAGVSLVAILLCLTVVSLRRRMTSWWLNPGLLVTATMCFILSIKAPGNSVRIHAETTTWLPDFYTSPMASHLNDSLRWILEAIINHTGLLLVALWIGIASLLYLNKRRSFVDNALIIFLVLMSVLSIGRGFDALHYWTTFHATWHTEVSSIGGSAAILVPWIVILITTPFAAIRALTNLPSRLIVTTLIICGYGTTVMMTLTPTMYASSWRSMLMPSMLIGIAAFITAVRAWERSQNQNKLLIYSTLTYSLSHYILQLSRMIVQK